MKLDPRNTGLALGSFAGLMHLFWSLLVALGLAQECMDWIYSIHFINNPYTVGAFDIVTALTLIIFTSAAGFILGWLFAIVWNYWEKK